MIFATLRLIHLLLFRFIGFLSFYIFKKRRLVAQKNIALCYQKLFNGAVFSRRESKKLVRNSFVLLGHTFGDFLLLPWYTKKNIDDYVRIKNLYYLKRVLDRGKGVIISTAHFGSWELAAHSFALKDFPSMIVYNPLKWPLWLDGYVKRRREIGGNCLISKQNSFFTLYKHLKHNGIISLLADQHSFPPEGIQTSLFGQTVWTHSTFIKMSLKIGAPIIPGFIFVKSLTKYVVELGKPLEPELFAKKKNPVISMASEYNKILERMIKRAPEHWMWQHRRFRGK